MENLDNNYNCNRESLTNPIHDDTREYSDTTEKMQLKHMSSKHRSMMRYLIAGKTVGEIAVIFGITPSRMSTIVNSPLFREERIAMEKEVNEEFVDNEGGKIHRNSVRQKLEEEALRSLDTVVGLRDNAVSERVRQLSALEILDRAGYKAAERIEGAVEIDASEGLINAISEAVKEMKGVPTKEVVGEVVKEGIK